MTTEKPQVALTGLSKAQLDEIREIFAEANMDVQAWPYVTNSAVDIGDVIRAIFKDFSLFDFVRDALLGAAFNKAIFSTWTYLQNFFPDKKRSGSIIHYVEETKTSINIILPNDMEDLEKTLKKIPDLLQKEHNDWNGKIVWIAYEKDKDDFKILLI